MGRPIGAYTMIIQKLALKPDDSRQPLSFWNQDTGSKIGSSEKSNFEELDHQRSHKAWVNESAE